jgi:hypothetical protein
MIWNKYKKFIIIVLIVALCWAISIFSALFLVKRIRNKVNEIQSQKVDQENTNKRISEIPKLEKQSELVKEKEDLISNLLNKDDAVNLIEEIEGLAEKTGNKVAIEISENSEKKQTKTAADKKDESKNKKTLLDKLPSDNYLKLNIKLNGKYDSIVNFIEKLENLKYYSDIISIKINSNEQKYKEVSETNVVFGQANQTEAEEIKPKPNVEMEAISDIEAVYYLEN